MTLCHFGNQDKSPLTSFDPFCLRVVLLGYLTGKRGLFVFA
jgi:hypothetical protein